MIQRIQTVWLFLAAIVLATLFLVDFYRYDATGFSIGNNYIAIALTVVSIVLSLFTIFQFKQRKKQLSLIWLNILVQIGLLAWLYISINKIVEGYSDANVKGYFWIGAFIPLVSIILLFLARGGIKKDEKLLKSLDRLR